MENEIIENKIMEEGSIFSDRLRKLAEKVKRLLTKEKCSIGGEIPGSEYYIWAELKKLCWAYNVQMNPHGLLHFLKLAKLIAPVLWPVARASGLEVKQFTEERVEKIMKAFKDNKDWINVTDQLHDDIIKETDEKLVAQIKKK